MIRLLRASLQARLFLGMGATLVPLLCLAAGTVLFLQGTIAAVDDIIHEASQEIIPSLHLQILLQKISLELHDHLIRASDRAAEPEGLIRLIQQVDITFARVRIDAFKLDDERALVRSAEEEWKRGRRMAEGILSTVRPAMSGDALEAVWRLHAHLDQAVAMLDQVHSLALKEMAEHLSLAHATTRRKTLWATTAAFVVGAGIALAIGIALTRSVRLPLGDLEAGAARFATGDLSHRISVTVEDELGRLGRTLNAMSESLARAQAALEDLSTHDGLTGLYNHREFRRRLAAEVERAWRYGHPFAMLMLDIDNFKAVNDTFGYLVGDQTLQDFAALIQREVRPTDHVARYRGEEFAVLLPETLGPGSMAMAERLRGVIADQPITIAPGEIVTFTVSIGMATYPEDAHSAERLIAAADQALYAAKEAGRNRVRRYASS